MTIVKYFIVCLDPTVAAMDKKLEKKMLRSESTTASNAVSAAAVPDDISNEIDNMLNCSASAIEDEEYYDEDEDEDEDEEDEDDDWAERDEEEDEDEEDEDDDWAERDEEEDEDEDEDRDTELTGDEEDDIDDVEEKVWAHSPIHDEKIIHKIAASKVFAFSSTGNKQAAAESYDWPTVLKLTESGMDRVFVDGKEIFVSGFNKISLKTDRNIDIVASNLRSRGLTEYAKSIDSLR